MLNEPDITYIDCITGNIYSVFHFTPWDKNEKLILNLKSLK